MAVAWKSVQVDEERANSRFLKVSASAKKRRTGNVENYLQSFYCVLITEVYDFSLSEKVHWEENSLFYRCCSDNDKRRKFCFATLMASVTESTMSSAWNAQVCVTHHILAPEGKCGHSRKQHKRGDSNSRPHTYTLIFSFPPSYKWWLIISSSATSRAAPAWNKKAPEAATLLVRGSLAQHCQRKGSCSALRTSSSGLLLLPVLAKPSAALPSTHSTECPLPDW